MCTLRPYACVGLFLGLFLGLLSSDILITQRTVHLQGRRSSNKKKKRKKTDIGTSTRKYGKLARCSWDGSIDETAGANIGS